MKTSKSIIIIALLAVVGIAGGVGFRLYQMMHTDSVDIRKEIQSGLAPGSPQYTLLKEQARFNILIMGEDDVEGSRRSDTVLFAAIDIDDKNMRVLSLPRDTRVEIPGHGIQKLNHAFAYGGPDLMKATIEKYLGHPILYYVIIDYDSFPAVVDTMGGVEIDVQKRMRYVDRAGKLDINIQPGLQVLDGKTALHFVRFRKDALGDIGRVHRQQQFMKAVLKKIYDPRVVVKIPELTSKLMQLFKTDMPSALAVQLAGFVQNELGRERIFFSMLHGQAATIDNLSYWLGDKKAAEAFLSTPVDVMMSGDIGEKPSTSNFAGLSLNYTSALEDVPGENNDKNGNNHSAAPQRKAEPEMTRDELLTVIKSMPESVAVLNGTGKAGLGLEVASRLQKIGVDVIHTGNAKHFDYQTSNVVYPLNAQQKISDTARILGSLLGVPKNLVRANQQAFYASIIIGHDYKNLISRLDRLLEISSK